MRLSFCLVFFFAFIGAYSGGQADSTKSKLKADANLSLNSNGIATIPAFSLDKPAVVASIELTRGRLSYDPMLAYGLDRRPWFIDNWLHYKIIDRPSFDLTTGINISMYFSNTNLNDAVFLKGERYFAISLQGIYKITSKNSLSVSYWNDRGQDEGTLKGHFINLVGERSNMAIGSKLLMTASVQCFYINYDGNNDGLFISPTISSSLKDLPFAIFLQATQPITTNITPAPVFKWNIGLSYTL